MSNKIRTITLYPDLYLEYNNSKCIVKYSYPEIKIPKRKKDKINLLYYKPEEIDSTEELHYLIQFLNSKSRTQSSFTPSLLNIICGIVCLILGIISLFYVIPTAILLFIFSIMSFAGFYKPLPAIKISSNYSSIEDVNAIETIINKYGAFRKKHQIYEKLIFDEGAKLLLFKYRLEPFYITNYEHETKSGEADRRYKNNKAYHTITGYKLEIISPGFYYVNSNFSRDWYDDFNQDISCIKTKINQIELEKDNPQTQTIQEENTNINQSYEEKNPVVISQKSRLITMLLCLFFGYLGIHNFYCGRYIKGIIYIVIVAFGFTVNKINETLNGLLFILVILLSIIDLLLIIAGKYKDGKKQLIKKWK